jgi:hypothetical protein
MRFIGLLKADKSSERGEPPSPELLARMGPFLEEVSKAGVLKATDGLYPSTHATRVRMVDGRPHVTDGPFAETKELVASYALFEVQSKEDAVYWTKRFLEALGEGECMIYQVFEQADFNQRCG